MSPTIYDATGKVVNVGDRIAVSFAHSSDAKIRVGTVTHFKNSTTSLQGFKSSVLMLHVEWEPNYFGKHVPKSSRIEANTGRFVRIN